MNREQRLEKLRPELHDADNAINEYVKLIGAQPSLSDIELKTSLLSLRFAYEVASRVIAFMPIAFGRHELKKLRIHPPCDFVDVSARNQKKMLAAEPVYVLANEWAELLINSNPAVFKEIACRSAEVNAVNKALSQGWTKDRLAQAEFSPPIITF